jgi:hypothetical protein
LNQDLCLLSKWVRDSKCTSCNARDSVTLLTSGDRLSLISPLTAFLIDRGHLLLLILLQQPGLRTGFSHVLWEGSDYRERSPLCPQCEGSCEGLKANPMTKDSIWEGTEGCRSNTRRGCPPCCFSPSANAASGLLCPEPRSGPASSPPFAHRIHFFHSHGVFQNTLSSAVHLTWSNPSLRPSTNPIPWKLSWGPWPETVSFLPSPFVISCC